MKKIKWKKIIRFKNKLIKRVQNLLKLIKIKNLYLVFSKKNDENIKISYFNIL
jgi:hypothetical protein